MESKTVLKSGILHLINSIIEPCVYVLSLTGAVRTFCGFPNLTLNAS